MTLKTVKVGLVIVAMFGYGTIQSQTERRGKPSPDKVMEKIDADENGTISLAEFKAAPINQDFKEEVVIKRFSRMDEDKNGEINIEELKKAIKHMKHRRIMRTHDDHN
jgi:Ca2+-binding EF-hand superfamily protein